MNNFLNSSLGRKAVMAVTGLFLSLFLVEHLYGNLLLYANDGGAAFIEYSHNMVHSIFIRIVEVVLFIAIVLHVVQAIYLTRQNSAARPVKYAVNKVNETSSWFSRNMGVTGSIIFFFIVVHLYQFFVPYRITGTVGDGGQMDVARAVEAGLQNPYYALLYFISTCFLAFHLNHGFQSAFQSLGLNNRRYTPLLKKAGTAFAVLIFIGFASFPVLFYFRIVTI
ncbi:MAG: succinate dehydrogenase cytochrome b subunit [Bacteroidota bacterium]